MSPKQQMIQDEYAFVGENLRNKNHVVLLVFLAVVKSESVVDKLPATCHGTIDDWQQVCGIFGCVCDMATHR